MDPLFKTMRHKATGTLVSLTSVDGGKTWQVEEGADPAADAQMTATDNREQGFDVPGNLGVTTGAVPKVPAAEQAPPPEDDGPLVAAERELAARQADTAKLLGSGDKHVPDDPWRTFGLGLTDGLSLGWAA